MTRPDQSPLVYPQVQNASFPVRLLSRTLSILFQGAGQMRGGLFGLGLLKAKSLPGRVISVGNIAVGGTGKTPTVIAICQWLRANDLRPAILVRGYGSSIRKGQWVALVSGKQVAGNCTPEQLPDEARLESESLPGVPVIIGPARYEAARSWMAHCGDQAVPTHWVLDDGFQHWNIKRDVDLVLLDAQDPFGNEAVLPWGMLREPPQALRRASHILVTGGTPAQKVVSQIEQISASKALFTATQVSSPLLIDLSGSVSFDVSKHVPILLVAGIARPERVKSELVADGIPVEKELFPGDHVALSATDLALATAKMSSVVTTAKDYWRNPKLFRELKIPVFIKNVRLVLPESLLTELR